jgi:hypothetical protein
MTLPREVVLDLLPLYVADEVSPETSSLMEEALSKDGELARAAREMAESDFLDEVHVPMSKEAEMEAYQKANKLMVVRTLGLAAIIAFSLLICAAMVFVPVAVLTLARMP